MSAHTIDLKPKVEKSLAKLASQRKMSLEEYMVNVLEGIVTEGSTRETNGNKTLEIEPQSRIDLDRLDAFFENFAKPGPLLPDEAFTREGIYGDHP
jgi:hypothetical protein